MQRGGKILNPELARAIVGLRRSDRLVVTDAGLPLPTGVPVLDLSVVAGLPSLADVLGAVVDQLEVETAYVAEEFATHSPGAYKAASELLARCDLHSVPHAELVKMLPDATLVVRTGECSHNANVVLVGGVTF